jgi:hypothetical protein
MARFGTKLRSFAARASNGDFGYLRQRLGKLIWSEQHWIIMRRDLTAPPPAPRAFAAFTVRPLEPDDEKALFAELPPDQRPEKEKLEYWLRRGLKGCHVAVLEDGAPCFMQWLLTSSENTLIRDIFEGSLPELSAGTVLLEGAYTPPRFRRLSIMPAAMARLAEKGRDLGARWAIVHVGNDKPSMKKAAELAGFEPYQLRVDHLRLSRRSVSSHTISNG